VGIIALAGLVSETGVVVTSMILELIIYPTIYLIWRGRQFKKDQ
jgi:hypothetical protein